jgi:uncharacterized protein (DUF58 family)
VRPTGRLAGVLLLGLVIYFYGASSEVSWLFLLAFWLLALAGAAYVYARWSSGGIRARIALKGARRGPASPLDDLPAVWLRAAAAASPVFEGDAVELELTLSAPSPRGPARLSGTLLGVPMSAATGLVSASGFRAVSRTGPLARGPLAAAGWTLETGDHLGLFRERVAAPAGEICLALPLIAALTDGARVREVEASVAAPRAGAGSELFGVREYRRGDSLRRIHWRSSARRGELVTREYEPPGRHLVGLFLDPEPVSRPSADQVARLAASEAWDCLRSGGRVVVWAPGLAATSLAEAGSLWSILEWLARYPEGDPVDDDPPAVAEAVAFVTGPSRALDYALASARRRGATARAWAVEAESELGVPTRRVGLEWPL